MKEKIQYRKELKYLIDTRDYIILKSRLSAIFSLDKNTPPEGYYHIRSLYFDDMKQSAYFDKLAGVKDRKKYRIRIYGHDDKLIRFEKKVKDNFASYKKSAIITKDEAVSAMHGDFSCFSQSKDPLLREIYIYDSSAVLSPSVITDYDREAYVFEPCNVRITLDRNIRTALNDYDIFNKDLPTVPVIGSGQTILEVKYDNALPNVVSKVIGSVDSVMLALSKFTLCKRYDTHNDWEGERWG